MKAHEGMSEKEFDKLLKLAKKDDSTAQYEIGLAYRNGWGVEWNGKEALNWIKKAAENGNPEAMCTLGHMYYMGDGGEKDYKKAKDWFTQAVVMGFPQCVANVNELYIAQALEEGNLKEAKTQLDVRKKTWDMPLSNHGLIYLAVELFFKRLQDLIANALPKGDFPAAGDESLHRGKNGNLWYQVDTGNPSVIASVFEYCRNDKPPFLAIGFYAPKHGASEDAVEKIFDQYKDRYACKDEGKNFGFGLLVSMNDDMFMEEEILPELAARAVKVYEAVNSAQETLASESN